MVETIKIGTKVYAYDSEAREPEVFESVIVGSFINIETGNLYYYLPQSKQPAYAIHESKEEAEASLERFVAFRKKVAALQKELDEERAALGEVNLKKELAGILYPEEEEK